LMYSTDSIKALFFTVNGLLTENNEFIVCSSFRVEASTRIILDLCKTFGLHRTVLVDTIGEESGCIIERFSRSKH